MSKKESIVEELFESAMQAIRDSIDEYYRMTEDIEADDEFSPATSANHFNEGLLIDIAEEKIKEAIDHTVCILVEEGEINTNE